MAGSRSQSIVGQESRSRSTGGLYCFLFTDIEGSTRLLHRLGPDRYHWVSDEHRRVAREVFGRAGGIEVDTAGDAFFVAFRSVGDGLVAAAGILRALGHHPDGDMRELRIRMGVHYGNAVRTRDSFVGLDVHRASRISALAYGGQVVVSEETVVAVDGELPDGLSFRDLGRHRLKDLSEPLRLYQLDIEGINNEFPALRSLEAFPTNLPVQLTPFIGRRSDVERLSELIGDEKTRIVTISGLGGVGKTRLALQSAAASVEEFPDGVYFVGLASITNPNFVLSVIAQTLDVSGSDASLLNSVSQFLSRKRLLLVLDNFEHVISSASVVRVLLERCPHLSFLVTSRKRLRLPGEIEYVVEPFAIPDPKRLPAVDALTSFDSIALFIDRAHAVKPNFALTQNNAQPVVDICARVDGIALAIELAAARTKMFSPSVLLKHLDKSLLALRGSHRDVPDRQATLTNTIQWSYELLEPSEQKLLNRLSVFTEGFTPEAARAVCDPDGQLKVQNTLISLTELSLLQARRSSDSSSRLNMLSLIGEFARAQLVQNQEDNQYRNRHASYFAGFAEKCENEWLTSAEISAVEPVQIEDANLHAAIDWALEANSIELAMRLMSACWVFWFRNTPWRRVKRNLFRILESLSDASSLDTEQVARVLLAPVAFYLQLEDMEQLEHNVRRIFELQQDRISLRTQAIAWHALGILKYQDNLDESAAAQQRAIYLAEKSKTQLFANWAKETLIWIQFAEHHDDEAHRLYNELIPQLKAANDINTLEACYRNMGYWEFKRGDLTRALKCFREGLEVQQQIHHYAGAMSSLVGVAISIAGTNSMLAVTLLSQRERFSNQTGIMMIGDWFQELLDLALMTLHERLLPEEFRKAWSKGEELSFDEAIELAVSAIS